jgi:nuclear pore complex protein Nup155
LFKVNTDDLNKQLKRVCPSLFTNENAIFTKACEKLKQALQLNDFVQRKYLIDDALELIKQINYVNNLQQICDTLRYAQCYDALCDLCLNAAQKRDPKNIALHYYHNGEPSDDLQGVEPS